MAFSLKLEKKNAINSFVSVSFNWMIFNCIHIDRYGVQVSNTLWQPSLLFNHIPRDMICDTMLVE